MGGRGLGRESYLIAVADTLYLVSIARARPANETSALLPVYLVKVALPLRETAILTKGRIKTKGRINTKKYLQIINFWWIWRSLPKMLIRDGMGVDKVFFCKI